MLTIELIPESCWYSNVRTEVDRKTWQKIKNYTFEKANYKCEICAGKGHKHPVECHEVWEYKHNTQQLKKCIALCPRCHEVKHIGFANIRGRGEEAIKWLKKVNNWNDLEVNEHILAQIDLFKQRSVIKWKLDIDWISKKVLIS